MSPKLPLVRLICLDVDGTLVGSSGLVPDGVWAAAERLRAAGIRLAVASGRPALGVAREHATRIDPEGWHVFQNGASLVHVKSGESRSTALAPASVARLIAHARAEAVDLELYTDLDYAVTPASERAHAHAALLGVPLPTQNFAALTAPIVRGQWLIPHERLPALMAFADAEITLSSARSPVMPDTTFVSITRAGVGKASAVRTLAQIHGVSLDQIMFVGDGHNDVEAMRTVGVAVAMGNAEPSAKAAAHLHVGHVDEGGLIEALALV